VNDLDAAGIENPALREGYRRCRRLNAVHGKSYYLATLLLPPAKRPYVHALYGFARYADDLIDLGGADDEQFSAWSRQVLDELDWGESSDPIMRALIDTTSHWNIPAAYFAEFLQSMRMDLRFDSYPTFDDLRAYMWGSAAVIGLQMLPILGRRDGAVRWDELEPYAITLGIAFQLTNFIRDVGEDLSRGRVYLPQDSLHAHGVDRARLLRGVADEPVRNLIAAEIARAREFYRQAQPGIDLVDPTSRDCLLTATALYGGILDRIEQADYDVLSRRAVVPVLRRARLGSRGLINAWMARVDAYGPATPMSTASTRSARIRTAGLRSARRRRGRH